MLKRLFRDIAFWGILLVLLVAASLIIRPKSNAQDSGMHDILANGYRSEAPDSIDVLFLGDSLVHTSFIPMRMWEQQGITSHICATNSQNLVKSASFLYDFLQFQHPKVVMLEANHLFREFDDTEILTAEAEHLLPVFEYHDRWKSIRPDEFFSPVEYSADYFEKGFTFISASVPAHPGDYMAPAAYSDPIPDRNKDVVAYIAGLCKENGAQLIIYSVPSPSNWTMPRHIAVSEFADTLQVPYIDANLVPEEIPIDWETESKDGGDHVNYWGACKVTDYFGKLLAQTGLFADKRSLPAYQNWNTQLRNYHTWLQSEIDG